MKLKNALLATALLAVSGVASAAEFWQYVPGNGNMDHNGFAQAAAVNVTDGTNSFSGNGGLFNGNFWTGPGAAPADSFFRYFCIELGQFTNSDPTVYNSGIIVNDPVAKLFDLAFPKNGAGDFWNGGITNFGLFANGTAAAAFQVALWNLYLDGDLTLAGGNFKWVGGPTAVSTAAQALLTAVGAYVGDGYQNWTLYRFIHPIPGCTAGAACGGYQDFLSATYKAPEPGSLALFGLALAGLGLASRRRRR